MLTAPDIPARPQTVSSARPAAGGTRTSVATAGLARTSAAAQSAGTARSRDRFVDVLRVSAIVLVVVQHWLMPALSYDDGVLVAGNALATPGAWVVTWVSQVMPLVFFAGGAAALYSLGRRRRHPHSAGGREDGTERQPHWLADRLRRLALPVIPLIAVWLPLPHLLLALGMPAQPVDLASRLAGRLLWFLALYVLVTALTPVLARLHRRFGGAELLPMATTAVVVDTLRFGAFDGAEPIGYLNILAVWATVYQLGIAYAAGSLGRLRGRRALTVSAVGLAVAAIAVALGPYPASMIGMPGEPVSNMNPPTAVLLAITAFQLGLALACRPVIEAWAANRPVARGIDYLSGRLMTIYVWHMPALVLVAGVAVVGRGWATPELLSEDWRSAMPIWLATLTVVLSVFVRVFGRIESRPGRATGAGSWRVRASSVSIGLGLLALTINGFAPSMATHPAGPVGAALAIALGVALLRTSRRVLGITPPPRSQLTGSPDGAEEGKVEA
ncbi:acyltransferase family protein [Phytoactinopolyspora halotolerans]|uniref:Acyltransferase n=1 Tax=Phytoactinopolyspora halotolerans TaxID=1981512 RepID=A0A6L9SCP6_9ACTN|nr:acyltransferase [Phytoactinopolyspora halotolerans]NEE02847.1 acyltransferase [Phytoactinopolyspora halotolerans]